MVQRKQGRTPTRETSGGGVEAVGLEEDEEEGEEEDEGTTEEVA